MNDRAYELKLMQFAPYWQELLAIWLGCILLLALVQVGLTFLGKDKPGEFARLATLFPFLTVMAMPPLASLLAAFKASQSHGVLAAFAVLIGGSLLGVFVAAKLKRLLVWVFTGFGRASRVKGGNVPSPADAPAATARRSGPLLNGQPVDWS